MDAALLRELQDRGRFFYERFPGAAAAEGSGNARELSGKKPRLRARAAAFRVRGKTRPARDLLPTRSP